MKNDSQLNSGFSPEYLAFVKGDNLPPLTNTQHHFAEWLLKKNKNAAVAIYSRTRSGRFNLYFYCCKKTPKIINKWAAALGIIQK